ncbi:protein KRI1 homolog [Stegodyphus dumicola]|uniref:protein KRI1 homolog n=1 Tax=Stegodyphus dumicola TaxID=202533 RepID=UPI0015A87D82|nr:protein KRI1 homolog [Stegodyphus dumicola]
MANLREDEEADYLKCLKGQEKEVPKDLKEVPGQNELNLNEDDTESDFHPEKLDEKTKEYFNDDYYAIQEEECSKFSYDEELDTEDWYHWIRSSKSDECGEEQLEESASETSGVEITNSKIYSKSQVKKEMIESTHTGMIKVRKKSLFDNIIPKLKPVMDPDGKTFDDYLDECNHLDYEVVEL